MKLLFFGTTLTSHSSRHARILQTLLRGVADLGHHVVFVESKPEKAESTDSTFCKVLRYDDWEGVKVRIAKEAQTASAIIVTDGFAEGPGAINWLWDLAVPAYVYYSLDPWATLDSLASDGATATLRAEQISQFDLVFSIAGGAAADAFLTRWNAAEIVPLYESIDTAEFFPRQPVDRLICDLALVADRDSAVQGVVESFVLEAAKELPGHRFVVAGKGWENAGSWPDNVTRVGEANLETRAQIYSSTRLALIPVTSDSVDYSLPIELLEATACSAPCAVISRPGIADLFERNREILIPDTTADLIPYLRDYADAEMVALGHEANKALLLKYAKLQAARRFEQRVARKFFSAQGNQ